VKARRHSSSVTAAPLPDRKARARWLSPSLDNPLLRFAGILAFWAALTWLCAPHESGTELPPLGPAERDVRATRDFTYWRPTPNLEEKRERAVRVQEVRYRGDASLRTRRVEGVGEAFRQLRPVHRRYLAERKKLVEAMEIEREERGAKRRKSRTVEVSAQPPRMSAASRLEDLDLSYASELAQLRPRAETALLLKAGSLDVETFKALEKEGFAEEVELVLTEALDVVLKQRIVKGRERLDDDLRRGLLLDASERVPPGERIEVLSVDEAASDVEQYLSLVFSQKSGTRFDDAALRSALVKIARAAIEPTFARDTEATRVAEEKARASVPESEPIALPRGQNIVKRGDPVTPEVLSKLVAMHEGERAQIGPRDVAAVGLLLGAVLLLFMAFADRYLHHFNRRPRDKLLLAAILLVHAASLRFFGALGEGVTQVFGLVPPVAWTLALPYALGSTLATLFLRPYASAAVTLVTVLVGALVARNLAVEGAEPSVHALIAVYALLVSLAGIYSTRHIHRRSALLAGTLLVGGTGMLGAASLAMLMTPASEPLWTVRNAIITAAGFAGGITNYFLVSAVTPILESAFNRLTDIKLLELASMNHPALRDLAMRAPGTYHHSIMVGNLAQAAADAVDANGLLARVGCYYHDLGKMAAPRYFGENMAGDNPHIKLKPHLSALIIRSHVKDGVELGLKYRLPDEIIDFMPQHHGTSLIGAFYNKARVAAEESGDDSGRVDENEFRYGGPKPQRRETAIVMLADSAEATAKALSDPNPQRLQELVRKVINQKLLDGQLSECDLTLRDLALIEEAFVHVLTGIYHQRPSYPPLRNFKAGPMGLIAERDLSPREAQGAREPSRVIAQSSQTAAGKEADSEIERITQSVDGGVGVSGPVPVDTREMGPDAGARAFRLGRLMKVIPGGQSLVTPQDGTDSKSAAETEGPRDGAEGSSARGVGPDRG